MRHTPEPVSSGTTPGARQLGREIRDGARWAYGASGLRPLALATHVWFAGQAVVLAAGLLRHGWSMGLSNSHEMAYRQRATPGALQARTNTTLRSLNRGVVGSPQRPS